MGFYFNGTNSDYLNMGNAAAIDIAGTALTIHCFCYPSSISLSTHRGIVSKGNIDGAFASGSTQYDLLIDPSGHVQSIIYSTDGNGDTAVSAAALSTSAWSSVAMVKNGTGADALVNYINGSVDGTTTSNRSMVNKTSELLIGRNEYGSYTTAFPGYIAEVAIWDTPLSFLDVEALARGVSARFVKTNNLRGFWPLGRNLKGTTPFDMSPSRNHGTANGSAFHQFFHPSTTSPFIN